MESVRDVNKTNRHVTVFSRGKTIDNFMVPISEHNQMKTLAHSLLSNVTHCIAVLLIATAFILCFVVNVGSAQEDVKIGPINWKRHIIVDHAKTSINSAVVSDFDEDGHNDVIASYEGGVFVQVGPDWRKIQVHKFDPSNSRNKPGRACIHSCLIDVDGDGDQDFVGSNQTLFWLECPDEPFSGAPWKYRTVDDEILGSHCVLAGDVNKDGKLDLIANSFQDESKTRFPFSIVWLEIPDDWATAKQWNRHVFADRDAPGGSHYMGLGDLNNDGRPDIACGAKGAPFANGEWFAWWEQPADATKAWKKHLLSDNHPGASNIHPVNVNGDEHMDIVATRGHGKGILWFKGPDFKEVEIDPEIAGPHTLVTADLDDDGDVDVAVCGRGDDGTAAWYQNDGTGKFQRFDIDAGQGSYDLRAVDMDGDGDLDLLNAGHQSQNIVWYENTITGK